MNLRLEGYARKQLSFGRGEGAVISDLTRLAPLSREGAREIVHRVLPILHERSFRIGRSLFRAGFLLLCIPATLFAGPLTALILFPAGARQSLVELVSVFVHVPLLSIPTVLGVSFLICGSRDMRRAREARP